MIDSSDLKLPSEAMLRDARSRFASLLGRKTSEHEWQRLFSDCPYILSMGLPLKLAHTDIRPLGRPGRSEADLIFYPSARDSPGSAGVIELKTPQSRILTRPRKEIVTLSRTAASAIQQARAYTEQLDSLLRRETALLFGGRSYIFVIIGLSTELQAKLTSDILQNSYKNVMPPDCTLIPFDSLFELFERSIPPRMFYLVPILDAKRPLDRELYNAVNREEFETAHALLDAGANPTFEDSAGFPNTGLTALHWAAFYGRTDLVQRLMRRGAKLDVRDGMGRTPLVCGAMRGHPDVVEFLLRHGADVFAMDYLGWTGLLLAQRQESVVKLLAKFGWFDLPDDVLRSNFRIPRADMLRGLLEDNLTAVRTKDDVRAEAYTTMSLANLQVACGERAAALSGYQKALELAAAIREDAWESGSVESEYYWRAIGASVRFSLALTLRGLGETAEALEHMEGAVRLYSEIGSPATSRAQAQLLELRRATHL